MEVQAEITIQFLTTGQILTNGAIGNEMVALYMLDKARDAIKLFHKQQLERKITPATAMDLPSSSRFGNGS